MKKVFKMLGAAMMCAMMAAGFSACSDDEGFDSGDKGSTTIPVGDKDYKFSKVGYIWMTEGIDGASYEVEIFFTNKEIWNAKPGDRFNMLVIHVPSDSKEIPTGTFRPGNYDLTFMANYDPYNEEGDGYYEEYEPNSSNLVISKDGSKYTISIEKMGLISEDDYNKPSYLTVDNFYYNGKIDSWQSKFHFEED